MRGQDITERNFRGVGKNPFFRAKLLATYAGRCARCGRVLRERPLWHLHHASYDHACVYPERVRIVVVRCRRGQERTGHANVPPCERCFTEHGAAFRACLDRTRPLCPGCHLAEHSLPAQAGEAVAEH